MLKVERNQQAGPQPYATHADFCRVFRDEMRPLYLLAFLLTANHAKAEECFLAALADAGKEGVVFKEFVGSWSRRIIIAHAIRLAALKSSSENGANDHWGEAEGDFSYFINRVAQLRPLERLVFVMTVLEHYQDVECAILLGSTRAEVMQARTRAFQSLAGTAQEERPPVQEMQHFELTGLVGNGSASDAKKSVA